MIAIPVLLMIGGISLGLYLRHRSIRIKKENLAQYMESGETYLRYDNYQKASEEYGEALRLAKNLKREEDTQEADQYKKLAEQIILADEAMTSGEYQKAQGLYLTAREMSVEAGNVGKSYIDSQLKQTKDYIDVFDLIELGFLFPGCIVKGGRLISGLFIGFNCTLHIAVRFLLLAQFN